MRPLIIGCALCVLCGCSTPYKSSGLMGGYSETQLAPDVFRVSFQGNGYTSGNRAQDFALRRAAELSLENGFQWFAIMDGSESSSTMSTTMPGTSFHSGTISTFGNYSSYSGSTIHTPGPTMSFRFPRSSLMIRCFKEKPEGLFVFDADFLVASIQEKYKSKAPRSTPIKGNSKIR